MKKRILKSFLIMAILAMVGYGGAKTYKMYIHDEQSQSLFLSNVEALADDQNEGTDGYYLHHFSCEITATAKLSAIFNVKVGGTIDISDMTQYFNKVAAGGEGPCNRGTDVTCNDAVNQVTGNNS